MEPALLDTDTLSEIMKGVDPSVQDNARRYLTVFRHFTFSMITRYEILRGLKARRATRQLARFEQLRLSRFMIYWASKTRRHHVWRMYSSRTCRTAPWSS